MIVRGHCSRGANKGAAMKTSIVKRSILLAGHKTSVSLENEFWEGLHQLARLRETTVTALLAQIDLGRTNANLSSAIRIFVLDQFRAQAEAAQQSPANGGATARTASNVSPRA